uniref:RNA methyltransferase n=1 Tax=Ditylenchus dipsaci TaxID=166011 RepID=A0A915ELK4_9BILA
MSSVTNKISSNGDHVEENGSVACSSSGTSLIANAKQNGTQDNGTQNVANKDRFRYGNYNRYYGTRIKERFQKDPRLELLPQKWFHQRAVLDIGCNVGFLTLCIAKEFAPNRILGIDIDGNLIGTARKNIRHYCESDTELIGKFPASLAGDSNKKAVDLTDSDDLLDMVKEEFNVIMALSITKWIHLNWGDEGLKRFFKRAFKHLRPGGRFILEPQDYSTYRKRSKITPEMNEHYKNIKFKPDNFTEYLLSKEVGFEKVEELGTPKNATSKGFERPLLVFIKAFQVNKKIKAMD